MTRTERQERLQSAPLTTFYLKNGAAPNDGNEILTGIRLMLSPDVKLYLVPSQQAIILRGLPDDIAMAKKIIADLDRPRRNYRVTFTLTETDNGKRVGSEHFVLVTEDGQRLTVKRGSKLPTLTVIDSGAKTASGDKIMQTSQDLALNFDLTVAGTEGGGSLKFKVDEYAADKTTTAAQTADLRQTTLEGVLMVATGKPLTLGSLDMPGSTAHLDIEVTLAAQ